LGRPPATSRALVERAAIDLMLTEGYDAVSVQRIASAAGIARSTYFRYFASKADAVWGAFDTAIDRLASALAETAPTVSTMTAVHTAVTVTTHQNAQDSEVWLSRFALLDSAPSLAAGAALRWSHWSQVIAAFVARRLGIEPTDVVPAAIAGAVQGAYLASLRKWLDTGLTDADPSARSWADFSGVCTALDVALATTHPRTTQADESPPPLRRGRSG